MRLEQFQNALIPVDMVLWAIYENGKTSVVVKIPEIGLTKSIDFEGDCLKKFLKWHKKMTKVTPESVIWPYRVEPSPNWTPPTIQLLGDEQTKSDTNTVKCVSHPL